MTYLVVGMIFGLIVGLFLSYAIFFQKETAIQPKPVPQATGQPMQQPPEHANIFEEIEKLKAVIQKNPADYPALVRLGNLYYDAVKYDKAKEYYDRAIEIHAEDPNVLTDLGICYRFTGDPQKAVEFFEKANSLNPAHWQSLYNIVIVAANDLNDISKAEEALSRFERANSDAKMINFLRTNIDNLKKQKAGAPPPSSDSAE